MSVCEIALLDWFFIYDHIYRYISRDRGTIVVRSMACQAGKIRYYLGIFVHYFH